MLIIVLNIAFFLLSNLRSCLKHFNVHNWWLNLNFFMRMSCFRRKIAFATFVLLFVELKKFKLRLIHKLNLDEIIKTNLLFNMFMIRQRLNELFENTLYILEFSWIVFKITIDVLINLIIHVFCENSVIVC